MRRDPYDVLDIPRDADNKQIKAAHWRAVKRSHPDVGGARGKFEEVQRAARILLNPASRSRFDETGDAEEEKPDNLIAGAMAMIESALRRVTTDPTIDVERRDLVELIVSVIRQVVAQLGTQKIEASQQADRFDRLAKKFKKRRGGGPDLICNRLREQASTGRKQVAALEEQIRAGRKAIEMAEEYDYEFEAVLSGYIVFGNSTTTTF